MSGQSYAYGTDAHLGGVDITLSLTPAEAAALGSESGQLVDWLDTALSALVALRAGQIVREGQPAVPGPDYWYWPINDLAHRLLPRLEGILAAAIREHASTGGSYGHLANAMDVAKSTAQRRRDALLAADPDGWERWARTGGPQRPAPTRTAAGPTEAHADPCPIGGCSNCGYPPDSDA
jgi:hypothetical protein